MIIGSDLIYFKELPSTNSYASELLKEKYPEEGTVIHTDFQTTGRGQKGNTWESQDGKNLLISIILYPDSIPANEQFLISMAVSLGICDFVDRYLFGRARIKWPNDIYISNDKIAGILIECSLMGEKIENCITGIGLNINQESFPDLLRKVTSLKLQKHKDFDRDICLNQLLKDIDDRYKKLLYGDRALMHREYIARLYKIGKKHLFSSSEGTFSGKIIDVELSGLLKIKTDDGRIKTFAFKELEFS